VKCETSVFSDPDERKNNGHMRGGGKGGGGKSQVIYRPGSGPLKKSGEPEEPKSRGGNRHGGNWRKPSLQLYQPPAGNSRESTPGPPEALPDRELAFKMSGLSTGDADSSDEKKKNKKPELPIYVPRPKAQAIAEGADEPPWEGQGGGGRGRKKMTSSNSWEQERKAKPDVWDRGERKKNDVPEWRKPSNKEQVQFITYLLIIYLFTKTLLFNFFIICIVKD